MFIEINIRYNFSKDASFTNNTFVLASSIFMNYFPSNKSIILGFVEYYKRIDDFTQDFMALNLVEKHQLSEALNLKILCFRFVRVSDTSLKQSFNLVLRALF